MPGCSVHFILAKAVLNRGIVAGLDRDGRAALMAGAIAPDMGYFPGGSKFVSDLAHYVKSGHLARNMLEQHADGNVRAFAVGWATHVLADALIHPLINRAAAEHVPQRHATTLTFADDPALHIRVEQGLDAVIAAKHGQSRANWVAPIAPDGITQWLTEAYRGAHEIDCHDDLKRSIQALARTIPRLASYGRVVSWWLAEPGAERPRAVHRLGFRAARTATTPFRKSALFGLTHPVQPPAWLVDKVEEAITSFPDQFAALQAKNWLTLPDFNLDTGIIEGLSDPYRLAVAARKELERRRSVK